MCGISGIFSLRGAPLPDVLGPMNATLVHRGPDDAGTFLDDRAGLAMRRLSIIGVQSGRQPLFSEDRTVALVLNGEIYNYRSLRARLLDRGHRFETASDAEVAIHLYEEYGDDFVDHLRGMFAAALYDRERRRLLIVRDRVGKKPIYYAARDGYLVFASEIKAIHASGLVPETLAVSEIGAYLACGFVPGERTLFEGVFKLPAGSMLEAAADGGTRIRQYWDLPDVGTELSLAEGSRRIRELMEEATRIRLMSEVPLGAFLSGGIDSSAVVGLMSRQLDRPVQTFSVGFGDSRLDELSHARAVARHFGTHHHEVVVRECRPELLREINWHQDEPAGDPASVPTFCLSRFARQHITVALTGEGGDETFAGYRHYRLGRRLAELERRLPGLAGLARGVGNLEPLLRRRLDPRISKALWIACLSPPQRMRAWVSAFTDAELDDLLPEDGPAHPGGGTADVFEALYERVADRDLLSQQLYVDSRLGLADHLLMKVDKMSMAASLEARCPLLDQELLEYAARLPPCMKLGDRGSKLVLREALRGVVPDEILGRPKQGFDVPLDTWLLRDLDELVSRCLLVPDAPLGRYLDLATVKSLWTRLRRTGDMRTAQKIWRILNLGVWHEIHWPSGILETDRTVAAPLEPGDPPPGITAAAR